MTTAPPADTQAESKTFYARHMISEGDNNRTTWTNFYAYRGYTADEVCESIAKSLSRRGLKGWTVQVKADPDGEIQVTRGHRDGWRADAVAEDSRPVGDSAPAQSEGQSAPEGEQRTGATGEDPVTDAELDAKLRKLLSELLGVSVEWPGMIDLRKADPDLLSTLKSAFNPVREHATAFANAHNRYMALMGYVQHAGGWGYLASSPTTRLLIVNSLGAIADAVEVFER